MDKQKVKPPSQEQQILHHLQNVGPLTAKTAIELMNCYRLAARIKDLRDAGHRIEGATIDGVHRYWIECDHSGGDCSKSGGIETGVWFWDCCGQEVVGNER